MASLFRIEHLQKGARDQDLLNRYWYYTPSGTTIPALNMAVGFMDTVGTGLKAIQNQEFSQVAVACTEVLAGANDALLTVVDGDGNQSGDGRASYDSYSFYMKPTGPIIKRGGKRIAGVAETRADDDVANADWDDDLALFATMLASGILLDGSIAIIPAIVRKTATSWIISQVFTALYRQLSTCRSRLLSRSGGGTGLQSLAYLTTDDYTMPSQSTTESPSDTGTFLTALLGGMIAPAVYGEVEIPF